MISGAMPPLPITYRLPVPSAQVKSAVLLAGLGAPGKTTVIERIPTRDHTEKLLKVFGAEITVKEEVGESHITLVGQPELSAQNVTVPGDPSSAAFPLVAALITPDSEVLVQGVGMIERRTGLFECLREMGADVRYNDPHVDEFRVDGDLVEAADDLATAVSEADIVVLLQPHRLILEADVMGAARRIFDTSGVLDGPNVERL